MIPARITVADEKRYARAFLFSLVFSQLCTNNAGACGHSYILELFERLRSFLKTQSISSTSQKQREVLNQISDDQFEDQPYLKWAELLHDIVDREDRSIFRSTAPLIYYWIIERHNTDRVYRQFGLIQHVPPPLHQWQRFDERASTTVVDYRIRSQKYLEAWEARKSTVITRSPAEGNCRGREDYLN
ncbi:hypothetical protein MRB53_016586 [Persea americana]|uniref:Uncharacterized protein n=1 Tax=Persea americana TaxID=3435 RepID=A0ACC2M2I7_PERAE|nr:hypothetical protein MRB53_016586 [Persea americana]